MLDDFTFGSFESLCAATALVVCPLLGENNVGYAPICFARNYEYQATHFLLFQPAALALRLFFMVTAMVMVVHVKSKYTAVGRTEFATFFYFFIVSLFLEALLESNLIPMASSVYQYFAAISNGINVATFWCLFVSGLVPLQWLEEGSFASLWFVRLSSLTMATLTALVSYATFHSALFFSQTKPIFLFILTILIPLLASVLYAGIQTYLVLKRLSTYWPLGDLALAVTFFALGQSVTFFLSEAICEQTRHYVDGSFFGTLCTGLTVMMIYKYWDTVTEDEDEACVLGRRDNWIVEENGDGAMGMEWQEKKETSWFTPTSQWSQLPPPQRSRFQGFDDLGRPRFQGSSGDYSRPSSGYV